MENEYKISIDSVLAIGKTHKVCEDYILHGDDPFPFVILSDGCSSAKHTDVGARLLAHAVRSTLHRISIVDTFDDEALMAFKETFHGMVKASLNSVGMDVSSAYATLSVMFIHDDYIHIIQFGDGAIFHAGTDWRTAIETSKYDGNAPFYPMYSNTEVYEGEHPEVVRTVAIYDSETWESIAENTVASQSTKVLHRRFPVSKTKMIMVASDGVDSFFDRVNNRTLSVKDVAVEVLDIPNGKGEFLLRQMSSRKGVLNEFKKLGIDNLDDLSIGGFIIKQ